MLNFNSEERECFTFDDVLLVPQYNEVKSRSQVDLSYSGHLGNLRIPIWLSPCIRPEVWVYSTVSCL